MSAWHLLLLSLPATQAGLRMRVWRSMKAAGAAALRDGVWLLPAEHAAAFADLAVEVEASGGTAERLVAEPADADQAARYLALFERTGEYRHFLAQAAELRAADAVPGRRQLAKLRRELEQLRAIDFFPGASAEAAASALLELELLAESGEPGSRQARLARLDISEYQGRAWATRARPWVDRLASAWLIRRFIDREARILWLARPIDCPADALGFDFDGAAFSHTRTADGLEWVSFETLLASFGLDADPALARIGRLVHYLDVGGAPLPEAAGLEALLAGMRATLADDDALLAAAGKTFDFLYTHYQPGEPAGE